MANFSNFKEFLTNPSRLRTIFFIVCGAVLLTIIITVSVVASKKDDSSSDNEEDKPTPDDPKLTPWESYIKSKKYLYVWDYPNSENFIQFLKDHKFSRIFMYVGCIEWNLNDFKNGNLHTPKECKGCDIKKDLARVSNEVKAEVQLAIYLNDDYDNFTNYKAMEEAAKALSNLKGTVNFTTLHLDIEPNKKENYPKMLEMFELAKKHIRLSVTLKPIWLTTTMESVRTYFNESYYEKFKNCETLVDAIMTICDEVDLMAYSKTYDGTNNRLNTFSEISKRHPNVEAKPIIELDKKVTDASIYYEYIKGHDAFFNYTVNVSETFDGLTYHQYNAWNQDLYCKIPASDDTYYFGEPLTCQ